MKIEDPLANIKVQKNVLPPAYDNYDVTCLYRE